MKVTDDNGLFDTAKLMIKVREINPPINLTLRRELNQSLFKKEAFHTLSWSYNPENDGLTITNYRVYRREAGEPDQNYLLIGTVSGDTFEYVDGYLDVSKKFVYVVTSVESGGHESGFSSPVGN